MFVVDYCIDNVMLENSVFQVLESRRLRKVGKSWTKKTRKRKNMKQ